MADLQSEYGARIRAIYERAELRIIAEVRRRVAAGIATPGWAEAKAAEIAALRAWLRGELPGLLGTVPDDIRTIVEQAYDEGAKGAGDDLVRANLMAPQPQPYARSASVRAIAGEATQAVTATHRGILRATQDVYRQVMAAAAEDVLTGVETRYTATRAALRQFADKGSTGFVDSAGRRWDMGSYAEMATRSAVIRAGNTGRLEKYGAAGEDLVIVSDHSESCDICNEYEGRVLSLTGKTQGYPTVADAEADGLMHPNCRHVYGLYIEGRTELPGPKSEKDKAEAHLMYQERMTQRRLERGVRQWKRREMAALDDVEKAQAQAKVGAWRTGLKRHVEAVNERRAGTGTPGTKRFPRREQI